MEREYEAVSDLHPASRNSKFPQLSSISASCGTRLLLRAQGLMQGLSKVPRELVADRTAFTGQLTSEISDSRKGELLDLWLAARLGKAS